MIKSSIQNYDISFKIDIEGYCRRHYAGKSFEKAWEAGEIDGEFSVQPESGEWDLFGSIDVLFCLYILDLLEKKTTTKSREAWAKKIIYCQGEEGVFNGRNRTLHGMEHSTAYALSGLRLLALGANLCLFDRLKAPAIYSKLIRSEVELVNWIRRIGLEFPKYRNKDGLYKSIKKSSWRLGWHNIWPGSHVGGGVAAAILMSRELLKERNGFEDRDIDQFFYRYFDILNKWVNPEYGVWKRGLTDIVFRKVTLRDIAGAVHFYWLYDAGGRKYPYAEELLRSCLSFKAESGLIDKRPYCIDFDFIYCIARSFGQLDISTKDKYYEKTKKFIDKNYNGIIEFFKNKISGIKYPNSHDLPGALAALAESETFYRANGTGIDYGLKHPFDIICWL